MSINIPTSQNFICEGTQQQKICAQCHTPITSKYGIKFCSKDCADIHHKNQMIISGENIRKKNIETYLMNPKKCINCDNIIDYNKRNNKFCSSICAGKHNNRIRYKKGYKLSDKARQIIADKRRIRTKVRTDKKNCMSDIRKII